MTGVEEGYQLLAPEQVRWRKHTDLTRVWGLRTSGSSVGQTASHRSNDRARAVQRPEPRRHGYPRRLQRQREMLKQRAVVMLTQWRTSEGRSTMWKRTQ